MCLKWRAAVAPDAVGRSWHDALSPQCLFGVTPAPAAMRDSSQHSAIEFTSSCLQDRVRNSIKIVVLLCCCCLSCCLCADRFEVPFNIWCDTCGEHIAKGVRFNAEKKQVRWWWWWGLEWSERGASGMCSLIGTQLSAATHSHTILGAPTQLTSTCTSQLLPPPPLRNQHNTPHTPTTPGWQLLLHQDLVLHDAPPLRLQDHNHNRPKERRVHCQ